MTTSLSIPLNIFFFHQTQTTPTSSFLHHQTVTFFRRKTTLKTACSGSQQNPQQRQSQRKKKLFNTNDTDSDGEKGYDPVGFLVKRGISHKAFAQFLRERQVIWFPFCRISVWIIWVCVVFVLLLESFIL
ncbi:unnamed protein product [Lathyrus sativus]|nr:unnamed protein product [Lathyrus sativus]